MGTFKSAARIWQQIYRQLPEALREIAERNRGFILELQRAQLRSGQGNDGNLLPTYQDDPFWKGNTAAADRYSRWKDKNVTPRRSALDKYYSQKPIDVMDFLIDGTTHREIDAKFTNKRMTFNSSVPWNDEINRKTKERAFGLNDTSLHVLRKEITHPQLAFEIAQKTGCPTK